MQSGQLLESVTILHPVLTDDDFGQRIETFTQGQTIMVQPGVKKGSERRINNINAQDYAVAFTTYYHYRGVISESDRIEWGGKTYRVTAIDENRRRNELYIYAEIADS